MDELSGLVSRAIEEKRTDYPAKTAFTELVRKYQDMVFGLVYAILQDHFLSQDVAQEAFIIAYNKLDTLLHHEAFPYWLQQIAKRESMKALKKRRRIALAPEAAASQEARETPPDEIYERKESRQQIRTALNNLPEGQRIPVVLYYIDGYSQAEIADFLELKTNTLVDGVEIDSTDTRGRTLLHWAVENDHVEAVRLLLKYGADKNIADRSRKTAYQLARKRKNTAILRLFDKEKT